VFFNPLDDERYDFMNIADDAQICKFEDASLSISIDGDRDFGAFYPDRKFICTGDPKGHQKGRKDFYPCLADLTFIGQNSPVNNGPGPADRPVQGISQLKDQLETSFSNTSSTANDPIRFFQADGLGIGFNPFDPSNPILSFLNTGKDPDHIGSLIGNRIFLGHGIEGKGQELGSLFPENYFFIKVLIGDRFDRYELITIDQDIDALRH
jgi:hypothetical protein